MSERHAHLIDVGAGALWETDQAADPDRFGDLFAVERGWYGRVAGAVLASMAGTRLAAYLVDAGVLVHARLWAPPAEPDAERERLVDDVTTWSTRAVPDGTSEAVWSPSERTELDLLAAATDRRELYEPGDARPVCAPALYHQASGPQARREPDDVALEVALDVAGRAAYLADIEDHPFGDHRPMSLRQFHELDTAWQDRYRASARTVLDAAASNGAVGYLVEHGALAPLDRWLAPPNPELALAEIDTRLARLAGHPAELRRGLEGEQRLIHESTGRTRPYGPGEPRPHRSPRLYQIRLTADLAAGDAAELAEALEIDTSTSEHLPRRNRTASHDGQPAAPSRERARLAAYAAPMTASSDASTSDCSPAGSAREDHHVKELGC